MKNLDNVQLKFSAISILIKTKKIGVIGGSSCH